MKYEYCCPDCGETVYHECPMSESKPKRVKCCSCKGLAERVWSHTHFVDVKWD